MDIVLVILLVMAFGGLGPWWGYSHSWGYGPGGIVGLILLIVIVRALMTGRRDI